MGAQAAMASIATVATAGRPKALSARIELLVR
jgi:hypothetical protein